MIDISNVKGTTMISFGILVHLIFTFCEIGTSIHPFHRRNPGLEGFVYNYTGSHAAQLAYKLRRILAILDYLPISNMVKCFHVFLTLYVLEITSIYPLYLHKITFILRNTN